jgi:hypothetical protein
MRPPNRIRERIELLAYVRAVPLLLLNPILLLGPLLVSILDEVISEAFPGSAGGYIGGGLASFCIFLLDTFGLAIAIIAADMVWRRGKTSFDEAWEEAKRKAGDILMAAFGLNFVLFFAAYAGSLISPYIGIGLILAAMVFLIYTVPAAAMSGVPGAAALQKSIDVVRAAPVNAVILTLVTIVTYFFANELPVHYFSGYSTLSLVIAALFKSIALSYIALILTERFNALAFARY